MALPTAAAVRSLTLRAITGTAEDTRIGILIATADEVAARWCLYPQAVDGVPPTLEETSYTVTVSRPDRSDPAVLRTLLRPITGITTITTDTGGDWTYATTIPSTDYASLIGGAIRLKPSSTYAWETGPRANRIVLTAGYDVGATPSLTLAIAMLVAHWWPLGVVPLGVQSQVVGGESTTREADAGLPPKVRQLLAPHRLTERETHMEVG